MKIIRILTLAVIILSALFYPVSAKEISEIAAQAGPAVVMILTYNNGLEAGQGSGFIIESGGKVITNYHVIRGADEAWVKLTDGGNYKIKGVYDYDPARDIAVLDVDGENLPWVGLGDSRTLAVGDAVVAIGNPKGLENTVSDGIVSALREIEGRGEFIQVTAPISPGSSGGALFDSEGLVVGVTTASYSGGQNLNFAVPIDEVKPMLKTRKTRTLAEVTGLAEGMTAYEANYYGWDALSMGDFDQAVTYFSQAIELDPEYASPRMGMGHVYYEKENFSKAIDYYNEVIELMPSDPSGYRSVAMAYYEMGKEEQALAELEKAYDIDPTDDRTTEMLGYLYEELERYQDAISLYQKLITAYPADPGPYYWMGNCQVLIEEWEQAIETYNKLLVVKPDLVQAHIGLGHANLGLGKTGTAVKEYETALAMRTWLEHEELMEALNGLGKARLKMGHHRKAEEVYKEMISLDRSSPQAHYGLGRACVARGDLEAAQEEADILEELDSELARALTEEIKSLK